MAKLTAAALLSALLVGGAAVHDGVLVVDVREADGSRVVVPVPLAVAGAGLSLAPEGARRVEAPRFGDYLPHAERALGALRGAPDGRLVRIVDGDERVVVSKEGRTLRVRAREGERSTVDVVVPLRSAEAAIRAYDEETGAFRVSRLLAALEAAPRGPMVHVTDGRERIRIRRLF